MPSPTPGAVYATAQDLQNLAINPNTYAALPAAAVAEALQAASATIDQALRGKYQFPILAWGYEVTRLCCHIAAEDLMVQRGFNPSAGADQIIVQRAERAHETLKLVARGVYTLAIQDSSPGNLVSDGTAAPSGQPEVEQGACVNSSGTPLRGWDRPWTG